MDQKNRPKGRPGMSQWQILVLGVLRLGLNADYDRIQELVCHHFSPKDYRLQMCRS